LTYLERNNYLTLRSKDKFPLSSLRYATHHLMVIHPHTKYHWPISKETIIWPCGQRTSSHEVHYGTRRTALWSYTHIPNIIDLSQIKNCYGPDKKILFKKQLFDLQVKGHGTKKVITVRDTPPYGHAPTYQISLTYLERQKSYGPDKLRWKEAEEAEAEEKNQTKTIYISLRSKGRHN
jgi:hypothetical protein